MNHNEHDERRDPDCEICDAELAAAMAEYAWMAKAVRQEPTPDEREAMEADRELMLDEFHGGNVR